MFSCLFFIVIGFFLLMKGADVLVNGASNIAKKFHVSTIIIGLTIVAIGTSMPELMVSLTASVTNHSDISIGNVIGSNLANLLLILGICSLIKPLKFEPQTERVDNFVVLFSTILLFFFANNNDNIISRFEGIILILGAIFFIFYNILIAKIENKVSVNQIDIKNTDKKNISILKSTFNVLFGILF